MAYEWWRWQANRELGSAEWRSHYHYGKRHHSSTSPGEVLDQQQSPEGSLYQSLGVVNSWNPMKTTDHQHHGGVFGSDFSPDG